VYDSRSRLVGDDDDDDDDDAFVRSFRPSRRRSIVSSLGRGASRRRMHARARD
jgi:hypothetical protein